MLSWRQPILVFIFTAAKPHFWFLLSFYWKLLGYSSWFYPVYTFFFERILHFSITFYLSSFVISSKIVDPFYLCINCLIELQILNLPSSKSLVLTLNRSRPQSRKWPSVPTTAPARNLEVTLDLLSTLTSLTSTHWQVSYHFSLQNSS